MVPLWLPAALKAKRPKAAGTALLVWIALHRWTNGNDRSCWPSGANIAEEACVSVSTCREALKLLREVGAVTWEQRQSPDGDLTTNLYRLWLDDPVARCRYTGQPVDGYTGQPVDGYTGQPVSNKTHGEVDPVEADPPPHPPPLTTLRAAHPPKRAEVDEEFETWWKLYPKKQAGKGQARERWRKMLVTERRDATSALERHATWWTEHETDMQFIPAGIVWLNQRRWEDEQPRSATVLKAVAPTNDWIARSKARRAALGIQIQTAAAGAQT